MKVAKQDLDQIIQEEINEIFGFGKKKAVKEYPASELATLVKGIDDASRLSGADLTRSQRTAIVKELTDVLEGQGFVVKENERLMTGEDDVIVTHQNAPKLKGFLDSIAQLNPKMLKRLVKLFNRSALDISKLVKDITPPVTTVGAAEDESAPEAAATPEAEATPEPEEESDFQKLNIGQVMAALNQIGLRRVQVQRAAKKALQNKYLPKQDRQIITLVATELIRVLDSGLGVKRKHSLETGGPGSVTYHKESLDRNADMKLSPVTLMVVENLYTSWKKRQQNGTTLNRWKVLSGVK